MANPFEDKPELLLKIKDGESLPTKFENVKKVVVEETKKKEKVQAKIKPAIEVEKIDVTYNEEEVKQEAQGIDINDE